MITTRDRSIPHNVAETSFDKTLDLIAGVYFNIICDLNLLKPFQSTTPSFSFFFSSLSLDQTPHLISKFARVTNTSTPWISPHYIFIFLEPSMPLLQFPAPPPRHDILVFLRPYFFSVLFTRILNSFIIKFFFRMFAQMKNVFQFFST